MKRVTYYARFAYCDDGICVNFPDVFNACTCGDTIEKAKSMAKDVLRMVLNVRENEVVDIYPPSTLDELESEANGFLADYEKRYEFIPITIIPENNSYLRVLKTNSEIGTRKTHYHND